MTPMLWSLAALALLFAASLTPAGADFRRRMMARFYDRMQRRHEGYLADRKRELLSVLSGTVLELGPGTGANFPYLAGRVDRWIGIEPNPHMHRPLREAAERHGIPADFRNVAAAGMEVADGSVDGVLSTLVLCSVPDPADVVADIRRVLRPGGRFVFVEHVAAPRGTARRAVQRTLRPLWRYIADGCCPDRELAQVLRSAGFSSLELEEFEVPKQAVPGIVAPHIAGVATRSS